MTTTRDDIRQWIKRAPKGTTHMIVACDTFEWEDFPVYADQDVHVIAAGARKGHGSLQSARRHRAANRSGQDIQL